MHKFQKLDSGVSKKGERAGIIHGTEAVNHFVHYKSKERCYAPEISVAYISSIGYAPEYSGT